MQHVDHNTEAVDRATRRTSSSSARRNAADVLAGPDGVLRVKWPAVSVSININTLILMY